MQKRLVKSDYLSLKHIDVNVRILALIEFTVKWRKEGNYEKTI